LSPPLKTPTNQKYDPVRDRSYPAPYRAYFVDDLGGERPTPAQFSDTEGYNRDGEADYARDRAAEATREDT
jgi:hypothetical protein